MLKKLKSKIAGKQSPPSATPQSPPTPANQPVPANQPTPKSLLAQMTLEEKCLMLHGKGIWEVAGCERLGIPEWTLSDGPLGVRGRNIGMGVEMAKGLMMPAPIAMAASFDEELLSESGTAIGTEAKDRKIQVLLAPTVNLHRVPTYGRAFECYSEDPHLTARMAVSFTKAVQAEGIGVCVKHFVANEQETERFISNSVVSEKTLRELYFVPFEMAVKEAGAKVIMGSYNLINGTQGCANRWTLTEVLREEWGFDGFVVTDWSALHSGKEPVLAGTDLEMPAGGYWSDGKLLELAKSGEIPPEVIDERVLNILRFLQWAGKLQGETDHNEQVIIHSGHAELARKAAASATVLVKNTKQLLPIADSTKSIALLGPNSLRPNAGGGGSAELGLRESPDLPTALREHLGEAVQITHHQCFSLDRDAPPLPDSWLHPDGTTVEFFAGRNISGEPVLTQQNAPIPVMYFGGNWPVPESHFLSVRQTLTITPDVSGPWRLCGAGFSDVLLYADGELVSNNRENSFSIAPGLTGGEGIVHLEAGKPIELVLEHTCQKQHQRFILSDIRAAPLQPAELEEAEILAGIQAASAADVAVVVVGSTSHWETEGADRPTLRLPLRQDELVRRCLEANPNTVVVVNSGAPMLLEWLDEAPAVLVNWYPGQEGAAALADVLVGAADPSGRMPVTWPKSFEDTCAGANVPKTYPGINSQVHYEEENLVGYRWFDAKDIEPAVCFGHGGSYASFEWTNPKVSGTFPDLTVSVDVTNTSERAGSEVVQLYVSTQDQNYPPQWLAGFTKLHLTSGETTTAQITLNNRSFSHWNEPTNSWQIPKTNFQLHLSHSSRNKAVNLPAKDTLRH